MNNKQEQNEQPVEIAPDPDRISDHVWAEVLSRMRTRRERRLVVMGIPDPSVMTGYDRFMTGRPK